MSAPGSGETGIERPAGYAELVQNGIASGELDAECVYLNSRLQWGIPIDTENQSPLPFTMTDARGSALEVVAMIHIGSLEMDSPRIDRLESAIDRADMSYAVARSPLGFYVKPLSSDDMRAGSAEATDACRRITEKGITFEGDEASVSLMLSSENRITAEANVMRRYGSSRPCLAHVERSGVAYRQANELQQASLLAQAVRIVVTGDMHDAAEAQQTLTLADQIRRMTDPSESVYSYDLTQELLRLMSQGDIWGMRDLHDALLRRELNTDVRQLSTPAGEQPRSDTHVYEAVRRRLDFVAGLADDLVVADRGSEAARPADKTGPVQQFYRIAVKYDPGDYSRDPDGA